VRQGKEGWHHGESNLANTEAWKATRGRLTGGGVSAQKSGGKGTVWEEEGDDRLGRVGRKAGWDGWPLGRLGQKLKENSFLNKKWIFEYTKALEICRRRFRKNFDMRIFPKIF
jgi:hypothetical protein